MVGLEHGPAVGGEQQSAATSARNSRYGLRLFAVYLACYGLFVGANAFVPDKMGEWQISGVNLAILGGLGLILLAFAQSLFYAWLCRRPAAS